MKCLIPLLTIVSVLLLSHAAVSQGSVCYSVSENASNNQLYVYDPISQTWTNVGATGTNNIEAIAYDPVNSLLYATNAGVFGTIDVNTGLFTMSCTLGSGNGDFDGDGMTDDVINMSDIDGLSYDPVTGILWASNRIGGTSNDVLFQIDPSTCTIIPNAFGAGMDYIVVPSVPDPTTGSPLLDVDDIAWDPFQGFLYMIQNQGGLGDVLGYYDVMNGTFHVVGTITQDDMEGLGLNYLGQLFGTTGNGGGSSFFSIDKTTGAATFLSAISTTHVDFESVDCLAGMSDLALQKVISPSQSFPIVAGDMVCFDINVYNQGDQDNYNIGLVDYIPSGLTLADAAWTQSGSNATYSIPGRLAPMQSIVVPICFTVDAGFSGTITNTSEISGSEDVNGAALPDIDSQPDSSNNETGVVDNEVNGGGPVAGEDEDDHDIASITVTCPQNCVDITVTRN